MPHPKVADAQHPVQELIAQRWSPYAFEPRSIEPAQLKSCLEAARWSASSYNEQPWRFFVAVRDSRELFEAYLSCLLEANQAWAGNASALILTAVSKTFSRNGKPNRVAEHDLGLAVGNLSLQATHLGLFVHQMAGVNLSLVRQVVRLPEELEPVTAIAVGHASMNPDPAFAERDESPRSRRPLDEFCYSGSYGEPLDL